LACYIPRWYSCLKTVTRPGTIRARRALTSFIRRTPLTTTPRLVTPPPPRSAPATLEAPIERQSPCTDGQETKISTSLSDESDALRCRPARLAAASRWRASCRDRLDDSSDDLGGGLTVAGRAGDGRPPPVRDVARSFRPASASAQPSVIHGRGSGNFRYGAVPSPRLPSSTLPSTPLPFPLEVGSPLNHSGGLGSAQSCPWVHFV